MVPLSIFGAAQTVSMLAIGCTKRLYTFYTSAKSVDVTVQGLYDEVKALKHTASSVESTLQLPELQAFADAQLWVDADACLQACAKSLSKLDVSLCGLGGTMGGSLLGKSITQIKLDLKEDQIQKYRVQIHSHRLALEAILHMINIRISSTAPVIVLDEVMPQLEVLRRMMIELQEDIRKVKELDDQAYEPLEDHDSLIINANEQLARSAQAVVMEVASTLEEETRSTIFDGTEPDLDFASGVGGIMLPSRMQSMRIGQRLGRIDEWISSWHGSLSSEQNMASTEPSSENAISAPLAMTINESGMPADEDYSSDEGIEVDVTNQYIKLGRGAAAQGNYKKAELFLKKALKNPGLLGRLSEPVSENTVKYELSIALMEQNKLTEAQDIFEALIKTKIRDDGDRTLILNGLYCLSQIHLASGDVVQAKLRCLKALQGQKRLYGKTGAYFNTVALLANISRVRGDKDDAEAYEALLPANFTKPSFKLQPAIPINDVVQENISTTEVITLSQRATIPVVEMRGQIDLDTPDSTPQWISPRVSSDTRKSFNSLTSELRQYASATHSTARPTPLASSSNCVLSVDDLRSKFNSRTTRFLDFDQFTPFAWGVARGDAGAVRHLLADEKDVSRSLANNGKSLGYTPLHLAAYLGHVDVAEVLIAYGQNMNAKADGVGTPLHEAVLGNSITMVTLLIAKGARETDNDWGYTQKRLAEHLGRYEIARLLKKKYSWWP